MQTVQQDANQKVMPPRMDHKDSLDASTQQGLEGQSGPLRVH